MANSASDNDCMKHSPFHVLLIELNAKFFPYATCEA